MHLLIPYASCSSEPCRQTLANLALPRLQRLLQRLSLTATDAGDDYTLSPPHERALARACGLPVEDGKIPWAAWQAASTPANPGHQAWALITPCHWQVGADHVTLGDPNALQLQEQESLALLDAMRPFFEEDGMALSYAAATRWLARGELFRNLATASLDRVLGRPIDAWMPEAPQARPLRRLQNEMQMLLYTHPVNDARAQRGLPPVNSFWVSGTGALPSPPPSPSGRGGNSPVVPDTLREAALRGNWPAWAQSWQQLDATEIERLLAALDEQGAATLTLCGERSACTYEARPQSLWRRISNPLGRKPLSFFLEQL